MPLPHVRLCNGHKRNGLPCTNAAVKGKAKCRQHGGKSLSGVAHGNYRHGRYSAFLPTRLAGNYHAGLTNPDLISMREDLAVCDARLADLFQRVDSGESGAVWKTLGTTLEAFNAAMTTHDPAGMQKHLVTLQALIRQGRSDYEAWTAIQSLWETRCRLAGTEQKTLVALHQMMTTEQLLLFMGVITDAIRRCVTAHVETGLAQTILGQLTTEFEGLIAGDAGGRD